MASLNLNLTILLIKAFFFYNFKSYHHTHLLSPKSSNIKTTYILMYSQISGYKSTLTIKMQNTLNFPEKVSLARLIFTYNIQVLYNKLKLVSFPGFLSSFKLTRLVEIRNEFHAGRLHKTLNRRHIIKSKQKSTK